MQTCYVAHPYGGDPANLVRAKNWMRWLLKGAPEVAWIAPWITDCEVLDETTDREAALLRDITVVKTCPAMLMVGPAASNGMSQEMMAAGRVLDMTGCITLTAGQAWRAAERVWGLPSELLPIDPRDILGRIVNGKSVGIDWIRVPRTYHGRDRSVWRPSWGCSAGEIARWAP